jgi:hypothetical protein
MQTRRTLFAITLAVCHKRSERTDRGYETEMLLPQIVLEPPMLECYLVRTRIPRHKIISLLHTPSQPRHLLDITAKIDTMPRTKPRVNASINAI